MYLLGIEALHRAIEACLHAQNVHLTRKDFIQLQQQYARVKTTSDTQNKAYAAELSSWVYVTCRMPATFSAIQQVLKQLPVNFRPRTALDVGAGTGSGTLAALGMFPDLQAIHLCDRQAELLSLGQQIRSQLNLHPPIHEHCTSIENFHQSGDLVICAYALNEIPAPGRLKLVQRLWDMCTGALVLIEPGTPNSYRTLMEVRDWVIEQNIHIAAPCSHVGRCPMAGEDWCHFHARVPRSTRMRQLKSGIKDYEEEPYSYLILTRDVSAGPVGARVLARPKKTPAGIEITTCAQDSPERRVIPKKHPRYKEIKQVKAGDCV